MKDIILFAENINSFVARSLETALNNIGISEYLFSFKDTVGNEIYKDSSLVVIVGCEEMERYGFSLQSIKSGCLENNRRVVAFGLHEENNLIREHLGSEVLIKEFIRPMVPANLAEGIKKVCLREAKRQIVRNVLVIDDSGMTLRTMMEWLENDYTVRVANSAMRATPMIEKEKPDLILLDYEMPECSGAEFFKMLKEREATGNIPVIFLTSKDDAATVRSVLELKPAGYVLKTSTREMLIKRIEEVLVKL